MTYLVDDKCIKCRYTDCVSVCPVDCFYIGENSIAINPDECIDCGVCVPECPEEAIWQTDDEEDPWFKHNLYFSTEGNWPNIVDAKEPMPEYEKYSGQSDKTKLFKKLPYKEI